MGRTDDHIIEVALAIQAERYPDASVVFVAGSLVRDDATQYSDLDLVILYPEIPYAYRESFRFAGYPVEAFVHDSETLEYFFVEVDRPTGIPALPQMVIEGVELPASNDVSRAAKKRAASLIAEGPPALDAQTERRMRYFVSDLIDDLHAPRSRDELIATGSRLYEQLADYHLRRQGLWSAKGKGIPRALRRADPEVSARYSQAFEDLFMRGEVGPVIRLAEELMQIAGGPLFDGYRADAPPSWRKSQRDKPV